MVVRFKIDFCTSMDRYCLLRNDWSKEDYGIASPLGCRQFLGHKYICFLFDVISRKRAFY